MSLVTASGLTKYYGAELIFDEVSFQVARGDKIGLVGANGAGKSTLLKIIAGIEQPSEGGMHLARGTTRAYLAQEVRFPAGCTLWEQMEAAFDHLQAIQREMAGLEAQLADTAHPAWEARMQRYGNLSHRFEHAGGYEMESRIRRTLHGLGFSEQHFDQQLGLMSGGQKTRAALAATLLSDPDLLLLDEPTNHLDLAALEWIEGFLRTWDGTLVVTSHDRYFLEKVTTRTFELALGRLEDYPGGYHRYLELRAERIEQQLKQWEAQQEHIARTEEFIRRNKAGQLTKQARGRERLLQRLKAGWSSVDGTKIEQLVTRPTNQQKVKIAMQGTLRSGDLVLAIDDLTVGYRKEAPLLRIRDRELRRGERVCLLGPNGSGKTTLLRTLLGQVQPLAGRFHFGYRVMPNYYAQGHDALRFDATVLDEIWRADPQLTEERARTLLGRFLFSGDDVFKRVGDLSGGERSRVALAMLTLLPGNLLILDEPTNHLDIDSRDALEAVLQDYPGSMLFVSHDRYFIDALASKLWICDGGAVHEFRGSYSEWVQSRQSPAEPAAARPTPQPAGTSSTGGTATAGARSPSSEQKQRARRAAALESELTTLEAEMARLRQELETASAAADVARITSLGRQYTELEALIERRYSEWVQLAA